MVLLSTHTAKILCLILAKYLASKLIHYHLFHVDKYILASVLVIQNRYQIITAIPFS